MLSKYRLTALLLQVILQFIPVLLCAFFHNLTRYSPLLHNHPMFLIYNTFTSVTYHPRLFKHRGLLCCISVRRLLDFVNIVTYYVDIVLTSTCTLVCTGGHVVYGRPSTTGYVVVHGITGRLARFTSQATVIIESRLACLYQSSYSQQQLCSTAPLPASFTSLPRTSIPFQS